MQKRQRARERGAAQACVSVSLCVCVRDARLAVAAVDSAAKPRIGRMTRQRVIL